MSEVRSCPPFICIGSVWEISSPAPHVVERILILVWVLVIHLADIESGIYIHPLGSFCIYTQRKVVFVEDIRFYLKDSLLVLVTSAQDKANLFTATCNLQVVALLRCPFLVHLTHRIPQTVKIGHPIPYLKILPHNHGFSLAVMGVVVYPVCNAGHKWLRLHAKHIKRLLAPLHSRLHGCNLSHLVFWELRQYGWRTPGEVVCIAGCELCTHLTALGLYENHAKSCPCSINGCGCCVFKYRNALNVI